MSRSISGKVKHRRTKKILKSAKGYRGGQSKLYRIAKQAVMRAGAYSYRDRKTKKRDLRKLWIIRINARARLSGMPYNSFMQGLKNAGVIINRKFLSDIATHDDVAFEKLVELAKAGAS